MFQAASFIITPRCYKKFGKASVELTKRIGWSRLCFSQVFRFCQGFLFLFSFFPSFSSFPLLFVRSRLGFQTKQRTHTQPLRGACFVRLCFSKPQSHLWKKIRSCFEKRAFSPKVVFAIFIFEKSVFTRNERKVL